MMNRLICVTSKKITASIEIDEDGYVVNAAPVFKWMIGKKQQVCIKWLIKVGYKRLIDNDNIDYQNYCLETEFEVKKEFLNNDRIYNLISYRFFVSKSKGRGRKRRNITEVHLVKYNVKNNDGFHLWRKFQFDVYASEILGYEADADDLRQAIINMWGF